MEKKCAIIINDRILNENILDLIDVSSILVRDLGHTVSNKVFFEWLKSNTLIEEMTISDHGYTSNQLPEETCKILSKFMGQCAIKKINLICFMGFDKIFKWLFQGFSEQENYEYNKGFITISRNVYKMDLRHTQSASYIIFELSENAPLKL